MAEYIEREALIKDLKKRIKESHSCRYSLIDEDFIDIVKDTPTADVVEVRHGKWRRTKEPLGFNEVDCMECSSCGESWITNEEFDFEETSKLWRYCPSCGAKIDGKDGEE